jgi:hypothetical protein
LPNSAVQFLSVDEAIAIHEWLIDIDSDRGFGFIVGSIERGECD